MSLELRWLRSFLAVAEEMHFSRAAAKLHLAQPALTAQIRQLEHALGAILFERTNRVAGLTSAGQALLPAARSLLEQATALGEVVHRAETGEVGRLRLGVIPPAATNHLAEVLQTFTATWPEVELSVQHGGQARLLEGLRQRDFDLLICRPVPASENSWQQRRLFTEEQGVILREGDALANLPFIPIRKLDHKRLLLLRGNPQFGQLLLHHASRHRVSLIPEYVAEDFPSLHWIVRTGLGISPCSLLLAEGLPRGLVAKPIRPAPSKMHIHAVWPGPKPSPTAERLLELL